MGSDEDSGSTYEYNDHWQIHISEGNEPDADRGFRITGYEWGWNCDECGVFHEDFNGGKPVTEGTVIECLNCGAEHTVSVDVSTGDE